MNQPLIDALPREKPLVILSFGFYPVIRPLLQAAGLSRATLICSRTLTRLENLRVTGKPAALQKYVPGWDLQRTLFITDSTDDDAVAEIVGKAHIVPWCPVADPAFKGYYLPLRYTVEGKYADRRYFTYQILQEDFALLLLAYSFSAYYVLSLGFLLLSLYTIYEIGYYKNDHEAAAKETNPVVSDAARNFPAHPRFKPWLGALIFGGIGISFATPLYAQPLYGSVLLAGWMLLLVGVYSLFWVFNHLAPINRIFIFPLLHTLKTFSFLFFVPLTLIGALLLAAQVLSISANYLLYRWGGNLQCFNRQAARLFLFGVFAMVLYANIFPVAFSADPIRPTLILVWGMIRTIENAYHKNILRIIAEFVKR
ncbi:MAG: hypothetical protein KAH38_08060, partial [Candidatus Hydrogenedentes bacterium]|nr:hypothetical protein [Candidatus Hydrogenedentota bacterium]